MLNSRCNYDSKFCFQGNCFQIPTHQTYLYFSFSFDLDLFKFVPNRAFFLKFQTPINTHIQTHTHTNTNKHKQTHRNKHRHIKIHKWALTSAVTTLNTQSK